MDHQRRLFGEGVNLNHSSANSGLGFAGPRAGNFNNGVLNIDGQDKDQNSDAYYWHQFRTDVTMKVNDNIKVVSEIYMIDAYTIWEDTTGCATESGNYVNVFKLWMQYTTPFGLFEIGRMPNGQVLNAFTNTDLQGDGIKFSPTLPEPFVLSLTTQKVDEDDSFGYNDQTDGDYDYYHIQAGYHTEKIVIDTALRFWDDARGKAGVDEEIEFTFTYNADTDDITIKDIVITEGEDPFNREYWTWWLAADLTFGKFYAKGELSWTFGDWESYEDDDNNDDLDIDAWALMLDAGVKLGDLDIGLMYFFLEGDDNDDVDDDMTAYMVQSGGAGGAFTPYYILTGPQTAMLNQDIHGGNTIDQEMRWAGVHCLGMHTDFQVTPKLSIHGALAYAWADETESLGDMTYENGSTDERDDSYGWEFDVGVAYKLLDNLTYSLNIGYLDTGDFFEVAYDDATGTILSYDTDDSNDIILVTNTLTMEF